MKIYQPERRDLLINTEWGVPRERLPQEEARSREMKLVLDRWVTGEEKKRLQDERHAYGSVRQLAYLCFFLFVLSLGYAKPAMENYGAWGMLSVVLGSAFCIGGIGLLRYALWGRTLATVLLVSLAGLPFLPVFADDKDSPFFLLIGAIGLYYLYRKTAGASFRVGRRHGHEKG
jgi:hypothetical protein